MLVIVSGAPGSGKTTMGTRLGVELKLPHLNRDLVRDGLWMTDGDDAALRTDRAWHIYLHEDVSVVTDQTFYRGLSDVTPSKRTCAYLPGGQRPLGGLERN